MINAPDVYHQALIIVIQRLYKKEAPTLPTSEISGEVVASFLFIDFI